MAEETTARPRRPLLDRLFARFAGLPPIGAFAARTLRIPMSEGVELGADLFVPAGPSKGVVLTYGPYGRGKVLSIGAARVYAGQGYVVLFVSTRGTFDSGGTFDPMRSERRDAQDIVTWMRRQPWYSGSFATVGASYLGFAQWALLVEPPEDLGAAVIMVGPHDFSRHFWGTGTFLMDLVGWSEQMALQGDGLGPGSILRLITAERRLRPVLEAIPLASAAREHFAEGAPWLYERLVKPDLDDELWAPMQNQVAVERARIPILLITGWQDLFTSQSFAQYARLRERNVDVALTCGPWTHIAVGGPAARAIHRESLAWLDAKLAGAEARRSAPVRVFVTGADRWRELEAWPPEASERELFLHDGELTATRPGAGAEEMTFRFDPADPTPTVGGPLIQGGGYVEDSALAARADVLTFDSEPLDADLTIMGTVRLRLAHRTERPDADLFVRLSDVDSKGRSHNVTEGYTRLPMDRGDGPVALDLRPAAHCFRRGHRVRVLVGGGNFPQYARNPGTGGNPLTATELHPNVHTLAPADGGCAVWLPVARDGA